MFLRDVLAQKLVAEFTVDPGEGEHTPGQYLGCGLSIAFGFPEISYRICRPESRIQPRHWKEQRREMRKKREKKEKRAAFAYSLWNFRVYFIFCELSQKKWPREFVLCGVRTDLDR